MGDVKTHEDVLELWNTIKRIVDANDSDMHRNANDNNIEAGIRARNTLRILVKRARELVNVTREIDRVIVKERKEQRTKKQ